MEKNEKYCKARNQTSYPAPMKQYFPFFFILDAWIVLFYETLRFPSKLSEALARWVQDLCKWNAIFFYLKGGVYRSVIHLRRSDIRLRALPDESSCSEILLAGNLCFFRHRYQHQPKRSSSSISTRTQKSCLETKWTAFSRAASFRLWRLNVSFCLYFPILMHSQSSAFCSCFSYVLLHLLFFLLLHMDSGGEQFGHRLYLIDCSELTARREEP